MIATTIQKILDKQELTEEERLELVFWFTRLQNAPAQLDTLFAGGVARITAASQITPNLGVMTAGKFLTPKSTSTSSIPTDAGFTGSFMSGNGETFNGEVYNVGGVNAGRLQWGASQTDGTLQAAEGLLYINDEGINFTSQGAALNFGNIAGFYREGFIFGGMQVISSEGLVTRFGLHSFVKNGVLKIDENFESGLSGWTQTGTPTLSTTYKTSGTYSCQVDSTNYISKSIAVTANKWYLISLKARITVLGSALNFNDTTFGDNYVSFQEPNKWTLLYFLYRANSTTTITWTFKGFDANPVYIDDIYAYQTDVFAYSGPGMDEEGSYEIVAGQEVLLGNLTTKNILKVNSSGVSVNSGLANLDTVIGGDTDASLLVTDASADKVGIGTATPTTKLDVVGTITTDGADLDGAVVMNEAGADKDIRIEGDTDTNNFFSDASTDRIGIGTATPSVKLDVAGSINVSTGNTYKVNGTTVLSGTVTGVTNGDSHDHAGGDGAVLSFLFPFATYIDLNPMTATGKFPYAGTAEASMSFVKWSIGAYTNGAAHSTSNYYTLTMKLRQSVPASDVTIATLDTKTLGSATQSTFSTTSFSTSSMTGTGYIYIEVTKTGTPADTYLTCPAFRCKLT